MSVTRYQPAPFNERVLHATEDGEYVKYEDYAALELRLIESERYGRQTDITIDNLEMKLAQMAAENAGIKNALEWLYETVSSESVFIPDEKYSSVTNAAQVMSETPATDAFLAEVRAQARNEGINYAASRLAAAFNHGFVDKPLAEVYDVVRMILTAKEDLANDPLPASDGLSGEYADKFLAEFAAQIRKGVQS